VQRFLCGAQIKVFIDWLQEDDDEDEDEDD
jgi:hypothetical protein